MRKGIILILGTVFLLGVVQGQEEVSVESGKEVVKKWIEARKLISREKADWTEDKVMLNESLRVFKQESEKITTEIDKANEDASKTQGEYDTLLTENKDIISANEKVTEMVKLYEKRLAVLIPKLPSALQDKMVPLTNKLPKDPENSKAQVTARMQIIVAILGEIEKFQNAISVVSELRKVASGEEKEVQTLYLGLGQGYYVDKSGAYAGVGLPGPQGWEWKEQPGLGPIIRKVIDQYEQKATASFSLLPVTISQK